MEYYLLRSASFREKYTNILIYLSPLITTVRTRETRRERQSEIDPLFASTRCVSTTITILFNIILLKGHANRPRTDAIVLRLFVARSQVEFFVLFFFFFSPKDGARTRVIRAGHYQKKNRACYNAKTIINRRRR